MSTEPKKLRIVDDLGRIQDIYFDGEYLWTDDMAPIEASEVLELDAVTITVVS